METMEIENVNPKPTVGAQGENAASRETEVQARAAWTALADPGDVTAGKLVEFFGPVSALDRLAELAKTATEPDDVKIRSCFRPFVLPPSLGKISGWIVRFQHLELSRELDLLAEAGGTLLIPGDANWPETLDTLGADKPLALWVRGNPETVKETEVEGAVALVGARSATRYGVSVAGELGYGLAEKGIWVVSGGAYGIDAAGHRGALAGGGKTLSVQAGGLGELYPAMNASLFAQILETGAIISEMPWSQTPQRRYFLSRNRLISALSQVVVVVEAGARSGAISTANHGVEQGRAVAAVPGQVTSCASVGCHELIRQGATLVTSPDDVVELMQPLTASARPRNGGPDTSQNAEGVVSRSLFSGLMKPETSKVLDSLPKRVWAQPEKIAQKAGLGISATLSELGLLELEGRVEAWEGRYRLAQVPLSSA